MDVERAREIIAAEAPRRLRLAELLASLGARDPDAPAILADGSGALAPDARDARDACDSRDASDVRGASDARDARVATGPDSSDVREPTVATKAPDAGPRIATDASSAPPIGATHVMGARAEQLTVGEIVDRAAEGGFGFLIGVLSLLAIPFVGLSTPFGLAIALIGGQMMLGRHKPWLPQRMRRRSLAMTMLDRVFGLLARRTRWLAKMTRRRFELAIQPRLVGLMIVLLSLALALPLPIPGSNLVFLVPLFIYAVALLERDGAWIVVGHVCTAIDVALLFVFGRTVWYVVTHLF